MGYIVICVVLYLILNVFYFKSKVKEIETRLKAMNTVIEQISAKVDIPEHPINDHLRKLVKEGKDVKAIKEARKSLGLSLLEAKNYVESL